MLLLQHSFNRTINKTKQKLILFLSLVSVQAVIKMRSHGKPVLNRLWSKNLLISLPWSLVGVEENVLALHEKRLISIYTTNSTMANMPNYNPNWTKQYLKSRKEEGKTVGYFQIWCKVARVYSKYKSQIL